MRSYGGPNPVWSFVRGGDRDADVPWGDGWVRTRAGDSVHMSGSSLGRASPACAWISAPSPRSCEQTPSCCSAPCLGWFATAAERLTPNNPRRHP